MCKVGDILLIYNARNKRPIGMHPFIVLDDTNGTVSGVYGYDFVGLLLTSANTEEKKERLKKFEGNFPISEDDKIMDENKGTDVRFSYVKADQFFYFDKSKIKYLHIGVLEPDIFNLIIEFIQELNSSGVLINQIVDKATKLEANDEIE